MKAIRHFSARPLKAVMAITLAIVATSALAAGNASSADAMKRHKGERAVCMKGQSNQDQATCLREAGAALASAKQGRWADDPAQYEVNARRRCQALPTDDRTACLARMDGQGTRSGSVAAGGIYRELVTRETVVPAIAAPDATRAPSTAK